MNADSGYADYIRGYCSQLQRDYSDLLPAGYQMSYFSTSASPQALYSYAHQLWTAVMANYVSNSSAKSGKKDDEFLTIKPHTGSDGSVYFVNAENNTLYAALLKQPNGLFSYSGQKSGITMLGGRGEFSTIANMTGDGDYFHDRKAAGEKAA